jgi:hypothetical protein
MKIPFLKLNGLILLLFSVFLLHSCLKDDCAETRMFVEVNPVFMTPEEIRVAPKFETARALENLGKIYVYQNYLMINEVREGIHIYDNVNPSNPVALGFMSIPGNVDIAIKEDILYADNFMDLLSIDISDLNNPVITHREEDVFSHIWFNENTGTYLVYYNETDRTMELDCADVNFDDRFIDWNGGIFLDTSFENNTSSGSTGVGGSLARFAIAKNHLYAIDQYQLYPFDLAKKSEPLKLESIQVGFGIETTFPYKDNLFIGANDGLYIYNLSNPGSPNYVSKFTHARACDPVYVQDDIAFVTLRNGSVCQSFTNQLDVVDISDIRNPELIVSHPMENPHGLSVRNDHLFICDGIKGLKSFDKSDLEEIPSNQLDHKKDIYAVDVISLASDHLIVVGPEALYQFSVDEDGDMNQISAINKSK